MQTVYTTLGDMPLYLLAFTEGVDEDDRASAAWKEYRFKGEIVRRDVHVTVKQGLVLFPEQATI